MTTMLTLAGSLDFNPLTDALKTSDGGEFRFSAPFGDELPTRGFDAGEDTFQAPPADSSDVEVIVAPTSDRLQLLDAFAPWSGSDLTGLPVLIKARGKCTTDHISMAGPWLKYRGHLQNISNNMLIGAVNDDNGETNNVVNQSTGEFGAVPEVAQQYRDSGLGWVVI